MASIYIACRGSHCDYDPGIFEVSLRYFVDVFCRIFSDTVLEDPATHDAERSVGPLLFGADFLRLCVSQIRFSLGCVYVNPLYASTS